MQQAPYSQAIETLEAWIGNPVEGLPPDLFLFVSRITPLINVDLLIGDDAKRILLTWRDDDIYGAGWHVPGGIIRYKETAAIRLHATAREELGAEVAFDPAPICVEEIIEPDRRVRGHFVSLIYNCRLTTPPSDGLRYLGGIPQRGQWMWHDRYPPNMIAVHKGYQRFFPASAKG
jgi:ADP-ribose pyrophosphatase YjhB (NUDIX family)